MAKCVKLTKREKEIIDGALNNYINLGDPHQRASITKIQKKMKTW